MKRVKTYDILPKSKEILLTGNTNRSSRIPVTFSSPVNVTPRHGQKFNARNSPTKII